MPVFFWVGSRWSTWLSAPKPSAYFCLVYKEFADGAHVSGRHGHPMAFGHPTTHCTCGLSASILVARLQVLDRFRRVQPVRIISTIVSELSFARSTRPFMTWWRKCGPRQSASQVGLCGHADLYNTAPTDGLPSGCTTSANSQLITLLRQTKPCCIVWSGGPAQG
jgi:hypothetical protein